MTGPTMLAMAKVDEMAPIHMARLCKGMMAVCTAKPPANMPEAPRPATALPTMRALEVGARAHTRLPISKMAR